jgi:fumarate hydratase class II
MFTMNLLRKHNGDAGTGLPPSPGLQPDTARCKGLIEGSLAMCTSLVPVIGYDASAALAKQAFKEGKTVRQLAEETVVGTKDAGGKTITRESLNEYLNPWSMTLPGGEGSAGG